MPAKDIEASNFIRTNGFYEKLKGKILLEVEKNGEAWYINPNENKGEKILYLGRPRDAFKIMQSYSIGISNEDICKIQIADMNLSNGPDDDQDGLSNIIEEALGTDKDLIDSDGDGRDDKYEILAGHNPNGDGKLFIDSNFADMQKGRILLQSRNNGEAWYVNPEDGKRYFLGRPRDAFNVMRKLGLGVSNNDIYQFKIEVDVCNNGENIEIVLLKQKKSIKDNNLILYEIKNPKIYKNKVVWVENKFIEDKTKNYYSLSNTEKIGENYRGYTFDKKFRVIKNNGDKIYLKDLNINETILIIHRDNEIRNLAVSGQYIVWEEYSEIILCWKYDENKKIVWKECNNEYKKAPRDVKKNAGIFYYNINTKEIKKINSESDKEITEPSLYDNKIVYWDKRNWIENYPKGYNRHVGDIYIYDLDSNKEIKLTDDAASYEPKIYNNIVVWFNDEDVFYKDLITNEIIQATNDDKFRGELFVSDKYIAWDNYGTNWQKVYGYGTIQGIEYYNIKTKNIKKLPLIDYGVNRIQRNPMINNDYLVYEAGPKSFEYSVYLYDIINDETLKINKKTYSTFVSTDSIVWMRHRTDGEYWVYRYKIN